MSPPVRAARRATATLLAGAAAALAGCGDDDDHANDPRPPAPINVTAAITNDQVTVSPREFGAGPITLIISNQSEAAQAVTLETDDVGAGGPGLTQTTSPINPRGTATLQVDVPRGRYELSVEDEGIQPAALSVGAQRASSQNELLLP